MALGWRGQYLRYRGFFLNITDLYKKRADLRAFLEVILSLSTITIFLLFALKPTALTIISLVKEIREKESMITTLDKKINDLELANDVFQKNESGIADVNTAVNTFAMPNVIAKQITGLASKEQVDILSISVGQTFLIGKAPAKKGSSGTKPISEKASEMNISLSLKGSYPNLIAFVKDLENLKIPVKIDTLSLNTTPTDTGNIMVGVVSARVPFLSKK